MRCEFEFYDGIEIIENMKLNFIYDSKSDSWTENYKIKLWIKKFDNFIKFYKKHRILMKSTISPWEDIQEKEELTTDLQTQLDLYDMVVKESKQQNKDYFLLNNNIIVGQISTQFILKNRELEENVNTKLNPLISKPEINNDASQGNK